MKGSLGSALAAALLFGAPQAFAAQITFTNSSGRRLCGVVGENRPSDFGLVSVVEGWRCADSGGAIEVDYGGTLFVAIYDAAGTSYSETHFAAFRRAQIAIPKDAYDAFGLAVIAFDGGEWGYSYFLGAGGWSPWRRAHDLGDLYAALDDRGFRFVAASTIEAASLGDAAIVDLAP